MADRRLSFSIFMRPAKSATWACHVAMGSAESARETVKISSQRRAIAGFSGNLGKTARAQFGVAQATTDQFTAYRVISSRAGLVALDRARFACATLPRASAA